MNIVHREEEAMEKIFFVCRQLSPWLFQKINEGSHAAACPRRRVNTSFCHVGICFSAAGDSLSFLSMMSSTVRAAASSQSLFRRGTLAIFAALSTAAAATVAAAVAWNVAAVAWNVAAALLECTAFASALPAAAVNAAFAGSLAVPVAAAIATVEKALAAAAVLQRTPVTAAVAAANALTTATDIAVAIAAAPPATLCRLQNVDSSDSKTTCFRCTYTRRGLAGPAAFIFPHCCLS